MNELGRAVGIPATVYLIIDRHKLPERIITNEASHDILHAQCDVAIIA